MIGSIATRGCYRIVLAGGSDGPVVFGRDKADAKARGRVLSFDVLTARLMHAYTGGHPQERVQTIVDEPRTMGSMLDALAAQAEHYHYRRGVGTSERSFDRRAPGRVLRRREPCRS